MASSCRLQEAFSSFERTGAADLALPRHVQYNALAGIAAGVFQCALPVMWLLPC